MAWTFERVAGPFNFTEGPLWDGEALLFTDIRPAASCATARRGTGGELRTDTEGANGLTFDRERRLIACAGGAPGGALPRTAVAALADRYQGQRLNSPNDLVVDSGAGLVHRSRLRRPLGDGPGARFVYRLDPQAGEAGRSPGDVRHHPPQRPVLAGRGHPVLAGRSPPGGKRSCGVSRWRTGASAPARVLHDFGDRGSTGCASTARRTSSPARLDPGGPGPRIAVFAPDGAVLDAHRCRTIPTNCAFGDADRGTLYVTDYTGAPQRARTDRGGMRALRLTSPRPLPPPVQPRSPTRPFPGTAGRRAATGRGRREGRRTEEATDAGVGLKPGGARPARRAARAASGERRGDTHRRPPPWPGALPGPPRRAAGGHGDGTGGSPAPRPDGALDPHAGHPLAGQAPEQPERHGRALGRHDLLRRPP